MDPVSNARRRCFCSRSNRLSSASWARLSARRSFAAFCSCFSSRSTEFMYWRFIRFLFKTVYSFRMTLLIWSATSSAFGPCVLKVFSCDCNSLYRSVIADCSSPLGVLGFVTKSRASFANDDRPVFSCRGCAISDKRERNASSSAAAADTAVFMSLMPLFFVITALCSACRVTSSESRKSVCGRTRFPRRTAFFGGIRTKGWINLIYLQY